MTLVAVSYGNSFVVVFCWAWPRSSCCFVALETKRKSGWGICGSSLFVLLWFCVMICHFHRYRPIALCTAFFTAYVVIRTVPQSINGQTREKKKIKVASSVEALAEAFEGTLRELRRLRRGFEGFLNGPSNSISQAPPVRYLTDCLGAVVWKAREFYFRAWYCGRQGGKFK